MKRCGSVDKVYSLGDMPTGGVGVLGLGLTLLLLMLSACSVAPSWPSMPLPDTMTRQDIERFRALEQQRLDNALRECYQRFAVNDCRREATSRHNETQHVLRAQELRLNALDREARQRKLLEAENPGSSVPLPTDTRP
jgi:hypothetical protein